MLLSPVLGARRQTTPMAVGIRPMTAAVFAKMGRLEGGKMELVVAMLWKRFVKMERKCRLTW